MLLSDLITCHMWDVVPQYGSPIELCIFENINSRFYCTVELKVIWWGHTPSVSGISGILGGAFYADTQGNIKIE